MSDAENSENTESGTSNGLRPSQPGVIASATVGRVRWTGQALRCPDCVVEVDRWSLSVEQPEGVAGDVAFAECGRGHRVEHPLLYPTIVYAVAEWTSRPDDDRPVKAYQQSDTGIFRGWVPHWIDWTHDAGHRVPIYRDWTQPEAAGIDWHRWPEIVAGQKRIEDITKWARHTDHTDWSLTWMSAWGTTDPDVRHIELITDATDAAAG